MAASYRGDGLEFSSFGWFPQFNKVSCLNFVCISSSKMYTNRYWVTKIARMRVFSFFIKITSGHRTLSRKASFWTIRTLSKDYGKDLVRWPEVFFPTPVNYSTQNVFATFHCLSWLFQLAFFSSSQLVYLLSPLHSNHKAIKEKKSDVLPLPMEWKRWQNKRQQLWSMNLSMEA